MSDHIFRDKEKIKNRDFTKKKRGLIQKRCILLLIIALLPLFKLVHTDDYCFGDADLVIIGGIAVLFFIAFLVVLFYNLYKISLKVELFNVTPLIIFVLFGFGLYFGIKNHNKSIFKNLVKSYATAKNDKTRGYLLLFDDKSVEYQLENDKYTCYFKGKYEYKNDTLLLSNFDLSDADLPKKYKVNNQILKKLDSDMVIFKNSDK